MKYLSLIMLILAFFLVLTGIGLAEMYPLTHFEDCSDTDFYVTVMGIGDLFEGAYELSYCESVLVKNGSHTWKCGCNHTLNLTLETIIAFEQTYSVSVVGVSKGLDYLALEDAQKNDFEVTVFKIPENETKKNKITGAVIGGKELAYGFGAIIIILIILLFIFVHYFGGFPWGDKSVRAANLHRKGQSAFEASNMNKAKRYYRRASKLRHK